MLMGNVRWSATYDDKLNLAIFGRKWPFRKLRKAIGKDLTKSRYCKVAEAFFEPAHP